jgi:hypothetical protein
VLVFRLCRAAFKALTALEYLVHAAPVSAPSDLVLLTIEVPEERNVILDPRHPAHAEAHRVASRPSPDPSPSRVAVLPQRRPVSTCQPGGR